MPAGPRPICHGFSLGFCCYLVAFITAGSRANDWNIWICGSSSEHSPRRFPNSRVSAPGSSHHHSCSHHHRCTHHHRGTDYDRGTDYHTLCGAGCATGNAGVTWFEWTRVNALSHRMIWGPKHYTMCSLQTPGSPTLKQHIQTIWYTYHQRMNENPGYTQWFWL